MEKQYVVGLGEILWDLLPEGKQLGGAPANFAYHVAQLGLDSKMVSAVGKDHLGDEIIQRLDGRGVDYVIERLSFPTGVVNVKIDAQGIPDYQIKEQVAWDYILFNERLKSLAKHTRAVCFGTLAQRGEVSRKTILAFLDAMPSAENAYRIFDINLRQHYYTKQVIESSLRKCNILKINDDELRIVAPLLGFAFLSLEESAQKIMYHYRLKMVVLTCGAEGSYVFTPDETSFFATPEVNVADTVGAGDSFTAAFVSAVLSGKSIRQAHELAVRVAAYVCTQAGAMPQLLNEFRDFL